MSITNTTTFTVTHAEYLSSKLAADLLQMQRLYGAPSDKAIDDFVQELIIMLKGGFLHSVDYGYRRDGKWVLALSYEVNLLTGAFVDNNPGRVPAGVDISGAVFWSFLRRGPSYWLLSDGQRESLDNSITIKRGTANDPQIGVFGNHDKTYSAGSQQIIRKIIT